MRVYYEHADQVNIPEGPEFEIAKQLLIFFEHKFKYRLMWELRSMEEEINNDGGVIIFTRDAKILFKEFENQDTVDKVKYLLSKVNFDAW